LRNDFTKAARAGALYRKPLTMYTYTSAFRPLASREFHPSHLRDYLGFGH
jgi:hypothetical protein